MPLQQILADYRAQVAKMNALIVTAHATDSTGRFVWAEDERIFITESSFLRFFIGWETFLEKSFIHYLRGNQSISGKTYVCYALPVDDIHANKILVGINKFVDWTKPEIVRKIAELYFLNGEPYNTVVSSIQSDLLDLKTIRNSAAHLSTTTRNQLDGLSTRKLQRPCNNFTIYDLILSNDPSNDINTILASYINILDAAAHQITM